MRPLVSSVEEPWSTKGRPGVGLCIAKRRPNWNEPIITVQTAQAVFFPLDRRLRLSKHPWSPQTIRQAVRLGTEIASYERASRFLQELTGVSFSKSSLQRLTGDLGKVAAVQEAQMARAMVQVPSREDEAVWRQPPAPPSETLSISADGVMVHLRREGWKEVKIMSVSTVTQEPDATTGTLQTTLSAHSYCAGLWDVKTFTPYYWAEAYRRGVERAKTTLCINDGAAWIWNMAFQCFSHRVEILDWWHAAQRLWDIALARLATQEAALWVQARQAEMAASQLRPLLRQVRLLFPRTQPLPKAVREAVVYLFHNRRRMNYAAYRQAGFPIGSGTIESACKSVVQARMKLAGMRWSRPGAMAMLTLRALSLSDRWHDLPALSYFLPISWDAPGQKMLFDSIYRLVVHSEQKVSPVL